MICFGRLLTFLISFIILGSSLSLYASVPREEKEEIDAYKVALSALDLSSYEKLELIDHGEDPTGFLSYQLRLNYEADHSFQLFMAGDHKDIPEEARALGAQVLLLNKAATYTEPYRFKGTFSFLDKVSAFDVLLHPQNGITIYHALTPFDLTIKGTTVINGIPENHFGLIYTPALLVEAKSFDNAYGGVIAKEGMGFQTIDGITNGRGIKKMVPYPVPSSNNNATITAPYYEPDDSYIYCDSILQMWGKKIINNFSSISAGGNFIVHDGCELLFNRGGTVEIGGSASVFADNIQIYQERDAVKYDMAATHGCWGTALLDQSAEPVFRMGGHCFFRAEKCQIMVPKGSPDPLYIGGNFGGEDKAGKPLQLMRHVYDQVSVRHTPPVIPMPDLSGMMSGFGGFERSFGSMSLGSPSFSSSSFTSSHDLRPSHSSNHPLNFRTNVGNVNVSINLGQFANQLLARAARTDEETIALMMMAFSEQQSSHTPLTTIEDKYNSALNIADVGKGDVLRKGGELIFKGLGKLLGSGRKAPKKAPSQQTPKVRNDDPKNTVAHQQHKKELARQMEKPHVEDPELQKIMNKLYRDEAKIGSGSTAAALRHEKLTGELVGGRSHSQKVSENIAKLEKWIKENPNARLKDKAAVENVLEDLKDAWNM